MGGVEDSAAAPRALGSWPPERRRDGQLQKNWPWTQTHVDVP
jgi:hypothetical protein